MKTKTKDLTGAQLDWMVAKCEGYDTAFASAGDVIILREGVTDYFDPHRNWRWGGPIIDREITKIFRNVGGTWSAMILKDVPIPPEDRGTSLALTRRAQWNGAGPTPLIAAMRCFCCSKLGDVVEVPDELF